MTESQSIEYKRFWRDEYLKWICGFANADGGMLVVGRDDQGRVVGLSNAAKLMVDLPNKVRDVLGILVEVNLRSEKGRDYLEIPVAPYPNPISYKGEYYYRSGSTNQMLKGSSLDRFLLRKHGRTWDSVPQPGVTIADLDPGALERFRYLAVRSRRIDDSIAEEPISQLLEKLHLVEGDYLTRAATLVFHPEPQRFVSGAIVKIGAFENNATLRYQDVIEGGLIAQVNQTIEVLQAKYLRAWISYEGMQRIETWPVPIPALREAVLNAVIHKDYASGIPIQISVYPDKLMIWNPGELPPNWTVEKLIGKHASIPFNPDVAGVFFRAGLIEAWGQGIERMFNVCQEAGMPLPIMEVESTGLWAVFQFRPEPQTGPGVADIDKAERVTKAAVRLGDRLGGRLGDRLGETESAVLRLIYGNSRVSTRKMAEEIGVSTTAIDKTLAKLKGEGILRRIGPPRSGYWEIIGGDDG